MSNDTDTDLRKNAEVEVTATTTRDSRTCTRITVDGEYEHTFDPESRVSKALEMMHPVQLQERLNGGHFFFVNGCLFDFRDCTYNGFIHTPDNIDALKNTIGIRPRGSGSRRKQNTQGKASLSKEWSSQQIQVPGMDAGGVFDSRLTFSWNPFVETIRSSFDVVRMICDNGMTGLASLFSAKIPLVNRWQEHLDIADMQIQNKLYAMLSERFQQMSIERATLADCLLLQNHVTNRIDDWKNASVQGDGTRYSRLQNLRSVVSPDLHLNRYYKPDALRDKRLAAQLPSHLTMFDAYNIATELATHAQQTGRSSDHALDRLANELLFDRHDRKQHAARFSGPSKAAFSDVDQAFFGDLNVNDEE